MRVIVESAFLKPVSETILLKKVREISEEETVKKSLDFLSKKVKDLKSSNEDKNFKTLCSRIFEENNYNGAGHEPFATIKLPKGKYMLTVNFLLKATRSVFYIYFNQTVPMGTNGLLYTPTNSDFYPVTVKRIHSVSQ